MFIASRISPKGVEGFNLEQLVSFTFTESHALQLWFSNGEKVDLKKEEAEQLYSFLARNTSLTLKGESK